MVIVAVSVSSDGARVFAGVLVVASGGVTTILPAEMAMVELLCVAGAAACSTPLITTKAVSPAKANSMAKGCERIQPMQE